MAPPLLLFSCVRLSTDQLTVNRANKPPVCPRAVMIHTFPVLLPSLTFADHIVDVSSTAMRQALQPHVNGHNGGLLSIPAHLVRHSYQLPCPHTYCHRLPTILTLPPDDTDTDTTFRRRQHRVPTSQRYRHRIPATPTLHPGDTNTVS